MFKSLPFQMLGILDDLFEEYEKSRDHEKSNFVLTLISVQSRRNNGDVKSSYLGFSMCKISNYANLGIVDDLKI